MTTDELRAAAERVMSVVTKSVEDGDVTYTRGARDRLGLREPYELAVAFLAEHPADDAEPVTAEWLDAIGGTPMNNAGEWRQFANRAAGVYVEVPPDASICDLALEGTGYATLWRDRRDITRGDVRRLLAALGVKS